MKQIAYSLLLLGLVQLPTHADDYNYAAASPIEKLDLPPTTKATDRILQQFTINTRAASTDDYLLEIARTGDINVLADVTDVPTETLSLPISGQHRLSGLNFYNLIKGRNLTMVRIAENTFLYWPSPDAKQLAQEILARKAATPRQDPPPLDAEQTNALLKDYFHRVHGWDGNWENVDIQVPVADLPPELRAHVDAEIYGREITRMAYPRFATGTQHSGVLDPQSPFWKTARLSIALGTRVIRGTPVPFLHLNRFEVIEATGRYTIEGTRIGHLKSLNLKKK